MPTLVVPSRRAAASTDHSAWERSNGSAPPIRSNQYQPPSPNWASERSRSVVVSPDTWTDVTRCWTPRAFERYTVTEPGPEVATVRRTDSTTVQRRQ